VQLVQFTDDGRAAPAGAPIIPISQINEGGGPAPPLGGLPAPPPGADEMATQRGPAYANSRPDDVGGAPMYTVQQPPYDPNQPGDAPPRFTEPFEDPLTYPSTVIIGLDEGRTGRFNIGVAMNSDAGVTGQVSFEERNFDVTRFPRSFADIWEGYAWRGDGQVFRAEAMPGAIVSRYAVSLTEPFLFDSQVSGTVAGSYFNRNYYDWFETRGGGRLGFGYRLADDLSVGLTTRVEDVEIDSIRIPGIADLDDVAGNNLLVGIQPSITHDTRDFPFMPSEGHYFQASFEQMFGDFQYPRVEVDFRKYFLLWQRPDGSGRHTLGMSIASGWSGEDTPIFEHFFLGGATTIRGFTFRGASPIDGGVTVGGEFQLYGSVEYYFPVTADDMVKGVVFCDYGTVEEKIDDIDWNDFRVAPGVGLRLNIPAMGQAPLALDFAFPIADAETDRKRVFTFNVGLAR
jgi:outer membrane protein insertion porin family